MTCISVRVDARVEGLTTALPRAARAQVRAHGGQAVEGYSEDPAEVGTEGTPGYMEPVPACERAGFAEIGRLSNGRSVYRADLRGS